jgi:hypothetical protein
MGIPTTQPPPVNINNPTKEIFGASGIYVNDTFRGLQVALIVGDPQVGSGFYAPDMPGQQSHIPNTGEYLAPVTTTPNPIPEPHAFADANMSFGNRFIDDMVVINNYIHYGPLFVINPTSFLQEAIVTFNQYNLGNR